MVHTEQLKRYFWFFFGIMGVVFFWTGVWDGLGNLCIGNWLGELSAWKRIGDLLCLSNPLASLAVGLIMLLVSRNTLKNLATMGEGLGEVSEVLHKVHNHPQKHEFDVKYRDKLREKEIRIGAKQIKSIEKGFMIFMEKGKEVFIPIHRVTEVLHKGKRHWKATKHGNED